MRTGLCSRCEGVAGWVKDYTIENLEIWESGRKHDGIPAGVVKTLIVGTAAYTDNENLQL